MQREKQTYSNVPVYRTLSKIFGKGNNTIILINGAGKNMNFWDPHFLKELSTNNSVIVFDSRGIGNTTLGNKPVTISQFANDTAGLLDAVNLFGSLFALFAISFIVFIVFSRYSRGPTIRPS